MSYFTLLINIGIQNTFEFIRNHSGVTRPRNIAMMYCIKD